MTLTIDIGNTSIGVAIFDGDEIVFRNKLLTPLEVTQKYLRSLIKTKLIGKEDHIVISSVVPLVDDQIRTELINLLEIDPMFINCNMDLGFSIDYDTPQEVGADLIAGASGALRFFEPPLIVVDSGTAITVGAVDESYQYLGGAILPGIEMSINGLASNTAKLNRIIFQIPDTAIGKNTSDSIKSGIYYYCHGGISILIDEYKKQIGEHAKVVATGGLSRFFKDRIEKIDHFEPDLIHFGLLRIQQRKLAL